MTKIQQIDQPIDSNVTIVPPKNIEIKYSVDNGWYVSIDGNIHKETLPHATPCIKYWKDAGEPLQWLMDRHLVVSKAYDVLRKEIKKLKPKK